jgi:hypothetical protein
VRGSIDRIKSSKVLNYSMCCIGITYVDEIVESQFSNISLPDRPTVTDSSRTFGQIGATLMKINASLIPDVE